MARSSGHHENLTDGIGEHVASTVTTTKQILPEYMMVMLRGRRSLDEDDTSEDDQIQAMSPMEVVRGCVAWRLGDPAWADTIAKLMLAAGVSPADFESTESTSALLALSAKWRKEAEELDLLGMNSKLHPYERAGYRCGAERIRRMINELDSASKPEMKEASNNVTGTKPNEHK